MGPLRITFYNQAFGAWPDVSAVGGDVEVRWACGADAVPDADAVVFHLPTLDPRVEVVKRAGQLWVAWSMESRVTCPLLDDPTWRLRFDVVATHERASAVWTPYFGPGTVPWLLRPPSPKTASSPVVMLQSNPYDTCGRTRFAFDLMRSVRVDSPGRVLRNCVLSVAPGWEGRVEVMRRYKFTLAFENSVSADYVSDKFFDPLSVGSVPIYRGTRDVAALAPAPDSYIDAADFSGPAELGAYLRALDRDPAAYARYHAWRERGLAPSFLAHLERLRDPWLERLARAVAARLAAGAER